MTIANLFVIPVFLLPLLVSFVISFLLAPLSIRLAHILGIIDDPSKSNHPKVIHKVKTPRGGVIGISISILVGCLIFVPLDIRIKAILAGVIILTIQGVLDDKYNLNPYIRLVVQAFAALLPIAAGVGIAYLTNPLGGIIDLSNPKISFFLFGEVHSIWLLSDAFALIWIVALMNFTNMGAKGVPGQLSGIVGISAIVIALLSLKFLGDITEWPVVTLASITAGAYFGFLPWHIYPQRIMPGFGGSTVAGYLLAILAILTTTKVGTLLVVLGVPLIDTSYTIIRRISNGHSPVWGDRGHLHHKLIDLGLSQEKTAIFYWVVTALLGAIALSLHAADKLYTILGVSILLGGFILWFKTRSK